MSEPTTTARIDAAESGSQEPDTTAHSIDTSTNGNVDLTAKPDNAARLDTAPSPPASKKEGLKASETAPPRKPGNLPAGATLADRIAALQKSSSIRSANGRGGADRSLSAAAPGGHSSGGGGTSEGHDSVRSISSGSRFGTSSNAAHVKDRIAKFQNGDRPLLPKSSFGSPAPMQERNSNALRPYPGATATGGGSGSWGEGILRPQMTGGTWVGAGEGRGWQAGGQDSIRPQLTGGAWVGAGGSAPYGRMRGSTSPMRQRDAFLDLDEDGSSLSSSPQKLRPASRRESSFSEAQLAAASMGLSRSPKPPSNDGTAESIGEHSSSVAESREGDASTSNVSTLYDLPEAPTKELVNDEQTVVATFPVPPSDVPTIKTPSARRLPTSNDVEIGIGNVTPEKMDKLRRTASGTYTESTAATSPTSESFQRSALLSDIQAHRLGRNASVRTARSNASADDGASGIGRLIISSGATSDGSAMDESSPLRRAQDLPHIQEGQADERARPEQLPSPSVVVSHDEAAALQGDGKADNKRMSILQAQIPRRSSSIHQRSNSNESGVIDPVAERLPDTDVAPAHLRDLSTESGRTDGVSITSPNALDQHTPRSAVSMVSSTSEGLNTQQLSSARAAQQAKEAITAARSKSQRLKRLPPGRMMTAAEMDASDDEYEPGWASVTTVISSSRQGGN